MSLDASASVGRYLSLISKSDIRYEGLLNNVDADTNTVCLRNVRILGTEGRKGGINEVPANDQIFANIVFRGTDIRDLTMYEQPQPQDPAIVSAVRGTGAVQNENAGGNKASNRGFYDDYSRGNDRHDNNRYDNNRRYNNNRGGGYRGRGGRGGGGGYRGGRGGGGYRRRGGHAHTGMDFSPAEGAAKEKFNEDFDFEKSRQEFEKKRGEFEKAKEDAKKEGKTYSKSSGFFDNLSSDQKDKGDNHRQDREEMKRADQETFGSEMVGNMRSGYHRGGRGRGGRGRYNNRY